jgi:hypothetical protein
MNDWKWNAIHNYLHWIDLYQLLGDAYSKAVVWYSSKGVKQEIGNADVPLLYSEKKYEQIIQYVENEMKGMEAVYQGILNEPFYFELLKLRQKVGAS